MAAWLRVIFLAVWAAVGFVPTASARPATRLADPSRQQLFAPVQGRFASRRFADLLSVHATIRSGRPQSGTPPELAAGGNAASLNTCLPTAGEGRPVRSRARRAPPTLS